MDDSYTWFKTQYDTAVLAAETAPDNPLLQQRVLAAEDSLAGYAAGQRSVLQGEFQCAWTTAKAKSNFFFSSAQETLARYIVHQFMVQNCLLVTMLAEMQWGKTGTFLLVAYYLCTHIDDKMLTDASQVFILTGLNDVEWRKQTVCRMLPKFRKNVFHRGQLRKAVHVLKKAKNALIIVDECHYGAGDKQLLKKTFEEAGLLNKEQLLNRKIRILQTSATPDNVLIDSHSWGVYHQTARPLETPDSYTGSAKLMEQQRVRESVDLTDPELVQELFEEIARYSEPKYHIFRLPKRIGGNDREEILDNLRAFQEDYGMDLLFHDSEKKIDKVDKLLSKKPLRHTVIVIVELWRAAKTIDDRHVGIVHERIPSKTNTTTIVQSLFGRFLGHNKSSEPIVYTSINAVNQYIELCAKEHNYINTKYCSQNLKSDGQGKLLSAPSHVHDVEGINHIRIESTKANKIGYQIFYGDEHGDPRKEAEDFVTNYLGKELPSKSKNKDGFYVQNDRNNSPLYLYSDYIDEERHFPRSKLRDNLKPLTKGLSGNSANNKKLTNWRQYALYLDTDDQTSLVWFVCWRKNVFPTAPSF